MRMAWLALGWCACGASVPSPPARLVGTVDLVSARDATRIEALGDDGQTISSMLSAEGAFDLGLPAEGVWSLRVVGAEVWPVALARAGRFDRALITQGRGYGRLGLVWVPPSGEVTRVPQALEGSCPEGRLADGTPCAVLEATVSCADGPPRPLEEPASLLLGTGGLGDLPGADSGVRYAVSARVPPPILWECPPLALP